MRNRMQSHVNLALQCASASHYIRFAMTTPGSFVSLADFHFSFLHPTAMNDNEIRRSPFHCKVPWHRIRPKPLTQLTANPLLFTLQLHQI